MSVLSTLGYSLLLLLKLVAALVALAVLAVLVLQYCRPTSRSLALASQDRLLSYFLRHSTYEVKSTPVHGLNYVIFRRRENVATTEGEGVCGEQQTLLQKSVSSERQTPAHCNSPLSTKPKKVLILTHGYASGLGFFFENFDSLTQYYDEVIGVDWLGMGCSCRHRKPVSRRTWYQYFFHNHNTLLHELTTQVTEEFIHSLEELRRVEGLTHFVLAGHSLGGYLSGHYAIKYPQYVQGLILASPAGLPEVPEEQHHMSDRELGWKYRVMKWTFWQLNVSPQSLIRLAGFTGPRWMEMVLKRRFGEGRWPEEASKLIYDYAYHITAAPGNGEYSLTVLLQPVFVKKIEESIASDDNSNNNSPGTYQSNRRRNHKSGVYGRKPLENKLTNCTAPVLVLFGDRDWMHYPDVHHTIDMWREHGVHAELAMIPNAGHLLYFENAKKFNEEIVEWSRRVVFPQP